MYYKPDWEQAKQRLLALWERELLDRCCVSVAAPKDGTTNVHIFASGECNPNDPADVEDYWLNPERILGRNKKRLEQAFFGGESLPIVMPNFGTSGHAVYYGASYQLTPETVWFDPVIHDLDTYDFRFRRDDSFYLRQQEIVKYLADQGQGEFFVSMPDNCGTLDAIGHLRGSAKVLMDLYDDPDTVSRAVQTMNEGWKESSELFYQTIRSCNDGGGCIGWMDVWAPGRIAQMQCDMSVMFSDAVYEDIALPELRGQMQWLEYPVYHFDGVEQTRHLDLILGLDELKMIQWTNVDGQKPPKHYIETLKQMQDAGKIILVFTPAGDIPELMEHLSSKGLYLHTYTSSEEEARQIIRRVEQCTHE